MNRPGIGWFVLGVVLASIFSAVIFSLVVRRSMATMLTGEDSEFVRAVDLKPLDRAAVYHEGRLKSYDSFATEILSAVSGRKRVFGQPPDFTYLDMILRPERYASEPVIYVKNKSMREALRMTLEGEGAMTAEAGAAFMKSGLIAEPMLDRRSVQEQMQRWSMDLVRTAKHADAVMAARQLKQPDLLLELLRVVPPTSGLVEQPWASLNTLWSPGPSFQPIEGGASAGMDPKVMAELRGAISRLSTAWKKQDAPAVNQAVSDLAAGLPKVAPAIYPEATRMTLQSLYFKSANMTWGWVVYLTSVILLLMSVAYRWERARLIGMGFFMVAFTVHTVALGWRWYVSGRWPNSNMFEAVTTSVWLGTVAVLVLEYAARRTPMRNVFAIGGACASMAALMAAHYVPQLNASINNMMPVLHDLWLYIHTNVIIASYALIAMASVTAGLYMVHRMLGGGAEYARVGGAAMLMDISDEGVNAGASLARRVPSVAEVLDGATMVLMELSFVMLWAGIVMGAIWADHSWGRPWGWDPKEVFALNTFLVFLVLIHVRLKAHDKGLWTAILAVIGCAVMLFNWIVINFVISGLHSYA